MNNKLIKYQYLQNVPKRTSLNEDERFKQRCIHIVKNLDIKTLKKIFKNENLGQGKDKNIRECTSIII